jgi:YfiH family protein
MNQVHSTTVTVVDRGGEAVDQTDGLVTATPSQALAVVTADCVPVLMADTRAGVVAAVHAGRVGAANGIIVRAVETMTGAGADVGDISVLLGPAVSGPNYEVPAEMADEVERSLPGSRTTTPAGTPGLDLRAGIARQLHALGVRSVDIDPRCTVEDPTLFSHRRDAPTGRLASLIWLVRKT